MMGRKGLRIGTMKKKIIGTMDFPGDTVGKNLPTAAEDTDVIPGLAICLVLWNCTYVPQLLSPCT